MKTYVFPKGAIEGVHYSIYEGRAYPIVRGGDGPLTQAQEAERDARYLADCLRDIHETAATRGAALTDPAERAAASALTEDEQARWDAGEAERVRLVGLIERHNAVAAAAQIPGAVQMGDSALRNTPGVIVRDDPFDLSDLRWDAGADAFRSKALGAIERVDGLSDAGREKAEGVLREVDTDGRLARHIAATGAPAYRTAFIKGAAGQQALWTDAERRAVEVARAASLTGNAGGYAVPFTLDPTIIDTGAGSRSPMRQIATIKQTLTNSWNGVTSDGVTARWAGEATQASDNAPTLWAAPIAVHKADVFVPFSIEIGQDWSGMEGEVRTMIIRAKDNLENTGHLLGDGSAKPYGLITDLVAYSKTVAPTTAEVFAKEDVYKVENEVAQRYLDNASWLGNRAWYNAIRNFDTAGGSAMWERIGAALPPQLLGYNAYVATPMDNVLPVASATANNYGLVLGDIREAYYIVDRVGLTVEFVPHLFGEDGRPTGQRGFYAYWRVGGRTVNPDAARVLSIPTTA